MNIPNTKRHPNNAKPDQILISYFEVIDKSIIPFLYMYLVYGERPTAIPKNVLALCSSSRSLGPYLHFLHWRRWLDTFGFLFATCLFLYRRFGFSSRTLFFLRFFLSVAVAGGPSFSLTVASLKGPNMLSLLSPINLPCDATDVDEGKPTAIGPRTPSRIRRAAKNLSAHDRHFFKLIFA